MEPIEFKIYQMQVPAIITVSRWDWSEFLQEQKRVVLENQPNKIVPIYIYIYKNKTSNLTNKPKLMCALFFL